MQGGQSTPQQAGQSPAPVGTPGSYGLMSPPQQAGLPAAPMGANAAPAQSMAAIGIDSTGQQRRAHLYVGNLSPRVTEHMLTEIFAVAGPVAQAKIIPDRNFQHAGLNYGFVEYSDIRAAEQALQTLNGRKIFDTEIRVNWAYQNTGTGAGAVAGGLPGAAPGVGGGMAGGAPVMTGMKEDTHNHFHVFVGDLSPEVNDEALTKAFNAFPTMSEARVMWDMNSGKSRGYGFLAFRDKADAEQAISTMNGEWLGSRAIRVNWANQKTQTGGSRTGLGGAPAPSNFQGGPLDFETVANQTGAFNTTVYVGNLIPYSTQADLIPLFQGYGYIVEIRMQADRGFAFVKLDTHEHAAQAIVNLQNYPVHGRPIKCSWGKDREGGALGSGGAVGPAVVSPAQGVVPLQQPGMAMMGGYPTMMYGMQPNAYAQYPGYGGYQAYGQPAAPGPAVAPVGTHQQGGYWPNQQPAGQWGAYYGGQPGQSS